MDLSISIGPAAGDTRRVTLAGRLDTHSYQQLDQQLAPLLETVQLRTLVLDFAGVDYVSSAGIRSVFKARKALAARNGKVLVANLQPQIQKVFDIVKAIPGGDIFRSTEELDAYLDRMQKRVLEGDDDEP